MIDKRAWIITGVLVLLALGAYVIWVRRAQAFYNARSLSAAQHHAEAAPKTTTLHVEGCREEFIVSLGEVVEPRIAPNAPVDQFRTLYGQESSQENGTYTWKTDPFELTLLPSTPPSPQAGSLQIALNGGHVVETVDGIELGLDSFGTILHKMRDRKIEIHERIQRSGEDWILTVSMYSACGRSFRAEYSRAIPSDPRTDSLINRRVAASDGQPGPLRSDIFMNKVSYNYALKESDGHDDSSAGELAEHN